LDRQRRKPRPQPRHALSGLTRGDFLLLAGGSVSHLARPLNAPMSLSLLSILLGVAVAVPQIYGLLRPAAFAAAVRRFPRNLPAGIVLMTLGTLWFLWNVWREPIADFAAAKPYLMLGFAAVGIGACVFVQDFLAVRGLAVVMLLLAKLMVDTGRPHLGETPWVLLIQTWAYVLVLGGMWFTVSPWRLRDLLNWATATEQRVRVGSAIRLAFALLVMTLGLTAFRGL
jgi:hypothetical protein